jgi:hypothetical protein
MNDNARINHFVLLTFVFTLLFCWSILQSVAVWDFRWLALTWASGCAQWMVLNRKRLHDELCQAQARPMMIAQRPEPDQQTAELVYRPQVQSANGNTVKYGHFRLPRHQWEELARVLFENDNRVVRDVVAKARAFGSITTNWNKINAEFERLGWATNGRLTDDGIAWFTGFLTPPTPTD